MSDAQAVLKSMPRWHNTNPIWENSYVSIYWHASTRTRLLIWLYFQILISNSFKSWKCGLLTILCITISTWATTEPRNLSFSVQDPYFRLFSWHNTYRLNAGHAGSCIHWMATDTHGRIFTAAIETILLYGCKHWWTLAAGFIKYLGGYTSRMLQIAFLVDWQQNIIKQHYLCDGLTSLWRDTNRMDQTIHPLPASSGATFFPSYPLETYM